MISRRIKYHKVWNHIYLKILPKNEIHSDNPLTSRRTDGGKNKPITLNDPLFVTYLSKDYG